MHTYAYVYVYILMYIVTAQTVIVSANQICSTYTHVRKFPPYPLTTRQQGALRTRRHCSLLTRLSPWSMKTRGVNESSLLLLPLDIIFHGRPFTNHRPDKRKFAYEVGYFVILMNHLHQKLITKS